METRALTLDRLKFLLNYDPGTGVFTWRVGRHHASLGKLAGHKSRRGYYQICLDHVNHYSSRLAWMYMTGQFPTRQIKYIDGQPGNNRFNNLREMPNAQSLEEIKERKALYTAKNKRMILLGLARTRARRKGLEFNISENDIEWGTHCPVLGIEIDYSVRGKHKDNSPTLDRSDNRKGYVRGNVCVISFRANEIKSNGTAEELRLVAEYAARCGI